MIKNVYDYFENLHNKNLPRENGSIIVDKDRVLPIERDLYENKYGQPHYYIDNQPYYAKPIRKIYSAMDLATSQMYNNIGIPTPPQDILCHPVSQAHKLISPSLHSVQDFVFSVAQTVVKQKDIIQFKIINDEKWGIFHDERIRETLLNYMTEECLDQLGGLYLVDELRTETDRHEGNYFFYKEIGSDKFQGIVAIDNELSEILLTRTQPNTKEGFLDFLRTAYSCYTPICMFDNNNYRNRVADIKDLIHNQDLSPSQIELLKRALSYDFPGEIQRSCNALEGKFVDLLPQPNLQNKTEQDILLSAYDATSRLWEYNRTELGSELGL